MGIAGEVRGEAKEEQVYLGCATTPDEGSRREKQQQEGRRREIDPSRRSICRAKREKNSERRSRSRSKAEEMREKVEEREARLD